MRAEAPASWLVCVARGTTPALRLVFTCDMYCEQRADSAHRHACDANEEGGLVLTPRCREHTRVSSSKHPRSVASVIHGVGRAVMASVKVLSTLLKAYSSTSSLCLTREGLPHHSRRTRARECLLTLVGSVSALLAVHVARKRKAQGRRCYLFRAQ